MFWFFFQQEWDLMNTTKKCHSPSSSLQSVSLHWSQQPPTVENGTVKRLCSKFNTWLGPVFIVRSINSYGYMQCDAPCSQI